MKFWTNKEHEQALNKEFCILINFPYERVTSHTYEFDLMVEQLLNLYDENSILYNEYQLIKFIPEKQFIVVYLDNKCHAKLYEQFDTLPQAEDSIKMIDDNLDNLFTASKCIINLEYHCPWFLKIGAYRDKWTSNCDLFL
jgi:hypothetical protein